MASIIEPNGYEIQQNMALKLASMDSNLGTVKENRNYNILFYI